MQLWLVLVLLLGWQADTGVQLSQAKVVDPYKTLGISKKATDEQIKQAYRTLARKYHPDKNKNKHATAKFIEVQEAYDVLSSPDKRQRWDAGGGDAGSDGAQQGWYPRQNARRWQWPADEASYDNVLPSATVALTRSNIANSVLYSLVPWLIQVYAEDSPACKKFARVWEDLHKAASSMSDGLSQPLLSLGRINWRYEMSLANWVANNRVLGGDFGWSSLPAVYAVPAECAQSECFIRYRGPMTMSGLQDFVASKLLKWQPIPQVNLVNLDVMLQKAHPAKVIALAFTKSDSQGSLQLRRLAQTQQSMMAFGLVSLSSNAAASTEATMGSANRTTDVLEQWSRRLGVTGLKASTLVLLRGPGTSPLVVPVKAAELEATIHERTLMWQAIPALRLHTLDPLGCHWGTSAGTYLQGDVVVAAQLCVVVVAHDRTVLDRARANMLQLSQYLQQPAQQPKSLRKQLKGLGEDVASGQVRLTWMDAQSHHAFCQHHFQALAAALRQQPEDFAAALTKDSRDTAAQERVQRMASAVCGRTWQEWVTRDLVHAAQRVNSDPAAVRAALSLLQQPPRRAALLAYKPSQPGASTQAADHHMFSLYTEVDLGSDWELGLGPDQLSDISTWLSSCLAAAGTSTPPWHAQDPLMAAPQGSPPQLMPDDEPGALEFVTDRLIQAVRLTVGIINACFSSGSWAPELQLITSLVATGFVLLIVHFAMSTQQEQQQQRRRPAQPDDRYQDVNGGGHGADAARQNTHNRGEG